MEFIRFLLQHWALTAALVIVFILLMYEELKVQKQNMSVTELVSAMNNEKLSILDVRDNKLYADGHIDNSINIPFARLKTDFKLDDVQEQLVIIGKSAFEEQSAARVLAKLGFSGCRFLHGGIDAWKKANMPLVRGKKK